ncbi:DGQHR domain-containing protein [Aliarcobacter cryaerophilus]|uniref:DGQHR domain-containing protein n=1 Tax=Aliarcobacter cryaerophilus TaxID=28198 RepID=UPI000826D736|nr:DGQHR domain-containing protein [Aliarcobacter cryaerophilus]
MKKIVMEYNQSIIKILSTILTSDEINNIAKPLIYTKGEKWGYQRKIKIDHVNKIVKYLREDKNHLFPTSIILALSEKTFNTIKKTAVSFNEFTYELDFSNIKDFHIVDGQHRLEALKKVGFSLDLSVLILIIPEDEKYIEVDVFTTINSKAKPIPTDLAELAKYKYILLAEEEKLQELTISDSIDYVSMKISIDLNDSDTSLWKNGIKVDINDKYNSGIVGISSFKKTIKGIVEISLEHLFKDNPKVSIDQLDIEADKIRNFLNDIWMICYDKWTFCFNKDEYKSYSNDFYIQKTLGVSVIHGLVKEIYDDKNLDNVKDKFRNLLYASKVKVEHWRAGGDMSGYSSESGFEKIRKFIKNIGTI